MRLSWSAEAQDDLAALANYIARDNPRAAVNQIRIIRAATARLRDHSHLGRPGRLDGTRELVVPGTNWIVIYLVRSPMIRILRVLHGAQQWPPQSPREA
ncbi:type II toxin-antitoxin system RelE/ParE family toxin [Zavarzinia sp. CC-PAN008]|uniref:type II toxin-antitoxin system RelE/ParE family toxin n=1 Tax=Zavarzinia sp. CC-PAN008 TaxID=3243332 RepID=UPI003F745B40